MEIVRLHTISVALHATSYLLIPVAIEAGDPSDDRAPWTRQRGSLTAAQSDVLCRHMAASLDVVEQVRALAHGAFTDADLGGDDEESSPPDDIVSLVRWCAVRCTGGRVYWW
ncbi:MAG TPA: hypothetical protein VIC60_06665 [Thermomicrobiales bacterium]|jgi:hypothetical protein